MNGNFVDNISWGMPFEEEEARQEQIEFFGQENIKEQLMPFLNSEFDSKFPHCLFIGEPGIGKTQLALWVAHKLGLSFIELLAPVKVHALPGEGTVLIDEAHRQLKPEPLFTVMKNPSGPIILAATTRPEKLEPAFASRFMMYRLDRYDHADMVAIVNDLAREPITEEQARVLASASAGLPRQATKLMAVAEGLGTYDAADVLRAARTTIEGLTDLHISIMVMLRQMNRPVGLAQLAILLYSHPDLVSQAERFLVTEGYIELARNGREITSKGNKYLKHLEKGIE